MSLVNMCSASHLLEKVWLRAEYTTLFPWGITCPFDLAFLAVRVRVHILKSAPAPGRGLYIRYPLFASVAGQCSSMSADDGELPDWFSAAVQRQQAERRAKAGALLD